MCTNEESGIANEVVILEWVVKFLEGLLSCEKVMGLCTLSERCCCFLQKTIVRVTQF